MLTKEPSFASLLIKQSPAMHYGHGWIMGKDGKRWHPCRSQALGMAYRQAAASACGLVNAVSAPGEWFYGSCYVYDRYR